MNPHRAAPRRPTDWLLYVIAPLLLAGIECVHPHPHHDLFELPVQRWLLIHYLQIPLFPLAALAVASLLRGDDGITATVARAAMFVFAISFTAFDAAAGVVTGLLLNVAHASADPESWRAAVMTVWNNPIVGASKDHPPLLAILGSLAWLIGCVATVVALWKTAAPRGALALLLLAALPLTLFRSHAWPGGPLTFAPVGLAVAWVKIGGRTREETQAEAPPTIARVARVARISP